MSRTLDLLTSNDPGTRNEPLEAVARDLSLAQLLSECAALDSFWRQSPNLYQRVRALMFLSNLYRHYLPRLLPSVNAGTVPLDACEHYFGRRYLEAIGRLSEEQQKQGPSEALASALAAAYRDLAFQTLADQVRHSVRTVRGNQWMFRLGHPADHALRIRPELLQRSGAEAGFPILREVTSVRMDFSHSCWSDIFFLAMDYPEGARVINASIDLGVRGRDAEPRPPIETYLRVLDQPVLRLVSLDLNAQATIQSLPEVFDFARDYLGLLKAALIASGVVPPGMEGCELPIADLLQRLVGPGLGLEIVSKVNDIPKGSRLAVSTNLLGSLIALCMRATGQVSALTGQLTEPDRRIVAARAILGEWLGGSGGGWQDSGGVWPGIKLIGGEQAGPDDPEFQTSRGRLLPRHHVFSEDEIGPESREALQNSLVLVHGGMAQNVGPILEMVTEKYLLRSRAEWKARQEAVARLDEMITALRNKDIRKLGELTTQNFEGPLQTIIPWCTNLFTDELIRQSRAEFGKDFWGFWMLGGMAGGGMGFLFAPEVQSRAKDWMKRTLAETKARLETSLPFAMEPVLYDFRINDRGTSADWLSGDTARMPDEYYGLMVPQWLRTEPRDLGPSAQRELALVSRLYSTAGTSARMPQLLLKRLLPEATNAAEARDSLEHLLQKHGFDAVQHEVIRADLKAGRIGLAQNRLPANTQIEDVRDEDVIEARAPLPSDVVRRGEDALRAGQAGVVTLAAGAGSRWTDGAGVVKALHPFCKLAGRHRRFVEVHLAKTRRSSRLAQAPAPHVITTGYLTHEPIQRYLQSQSWTGLGPVLVSPGKSVGLRLIPMQRDLLFAWEETPQQVLDVQQQKVRNSLRIALADWVRSVGEATGYPDNLPLQCLHPVGHWYEVPNMLLNGVLRDLLRVQPSLQYLLLHNVDTLGANLDPGLLGLHIEGGATLSYEVVSRRFDDRGGGLARVDDRVRIVEGLAMPREEIEFDLRFYNSMTTWITIDRLLEVFGLRRDQLEDAEAVSQAVRRLSQRLPTYVTLKNVKKRWGHGHEDVYPVMQFEKLWGDMTALPEIDCQFLAVPVFRGQQLKQQSQLDGWLRDGSAAQTADLCDW